MAVPCKEWWTRRTIDLPAWNGSARAFAHPSRGPNRAASGAMELWLSAWPTTPQPHPAPDRRRLRMAAVVFVVIRSEEVGVRSLQLGQEPVDPANSILRRGGGEHGRAKRLGARSPAERLEYPLIVESLIDGLDHRIIKLRYVDVSFQSPAFLDGKCFGALPVGHTRPSERGDEQRDTSQTQRNKNLSHGVPCADRALTERERAQ
jgi:hypothetical protein